MKGILFKPESIKAIVEGRKTQTRRVIKHNLPELDELRQYWGSLSDKTDEELKQIRDDVWISKARYQVGEVVYVKEAWRAEAFYDLRPPYDIGPYALIDYKLTPWELNTKFGRWRSPLHLREVHARYFLEITGIRAEKLQEIPEVDAIKEGCTIMAGVTAGGNIGLVSARYAYMLLWDSINKATPWASNPWVWVYEFKRVNHS